MFDNRTSKPQTWVWILAGVAVTLVFGDSVTAGLFNITGQPTVTTLESGFGVPLGTYELTGSIDITVVRGLGSKAVFSVETYALSMDVDSSGAFFEASDVIVETTPFINILTVEPAFIATASQLPGPITLTTFAIDGTWNLTGRVGEYGGPELFSGDGSDVPPTLASGTFSGSILDPTELLMTTGYRGSQQRLGPFNIIEPFSPLRFTAVPEPTTPSLLIIAGFAVLRRHRGR